MKPLLCTSLLFACSAFGQTIPWAFETTPIPSSQAGDPAFLFQPVPAPQGTSFIVGTDEVNPGLYLWTPTPGAPPSVLQLGIFSSADSRGPLLVAASRFTNSLSVFALVNGSLVQFDTGDFNVATPQHVALRQTPARQFEVVVDTGSTVVERYSLAFTPAGRVVFTALPSINVNEAPSGLAVDDRTGAIYIAQPSRGVLVTIPPMNPRFLVSIDAGQLGSAVGGIDLYQAADGGTFVLTTAPNEGRVNVHDRAGGFLASLSFSGDAGQTLQPQELEVFEPATPEFPRGVLVLQDTLTATYKIVSLDAVNDMFPLPEPYIPSPINVDGGVGVDAGPPSDGGLDGGLAGGTDGGTDGGATDGGVDGGLPSGAGGGIGGTPGRPPAGVEPPQGCTCSGSPFALLFALLSLWFVRRRRTAP